MASKNKYWYLHPKHKKNVRYRCTTCGAQFREMQDSEKMMRHSEYQNYWHLGFIQATSPRREDEFRTVSDTISFYRKEWELDG